MRIVSGAGSLAVMAVLGILLVFFFPAHFGAFSVTHGPATAFRAVATAWRIFSALSAALLMAVFRSAVLRSHCATRAFAQKNYGSGFFALRC